MARSGLRQWCLVAAAMSRWPVSRSRLVALLRRLALTRGRVLLRTWERSSS